MTAEIAILNRSAVALAADSAVSIQQGHQTKVYNSMNKLFTLSKSAPVGVMIYGTAQLTGMPWETLIKLYRQQLANRTFGTVSEYTEDFIRFVQEKDCYFPDDEQKDYVVSRAIQAFATIHYEAFHHDLHDIAEAGEEINARVISRVYSEEIRTMKRLLSAFPDLTGFDEAFAKRVVEKYDSDINDAISEIFEGHKFSKTQTQLLKDVVALLLYKDFF